MIEEGLYEISYNEGIRELNPPFSLKAPSTVRIKILDSRIDIIDPSKSCEAAAGVDLKDPDNPILYVFLPTLDVSDSTIRWINFGTGFKTIIIHEFLHLCGDVMTSQKEIVDGVIRHTRVGSEALRNLLDDHRLS